MDYRASRQRSGFPRMASISIMPPALPGSLGFTTTWVGMEPACPKPGHFRRFGPAKRRSKTRLGTVRILDRLTPFVFSVYDGGEGGIRSRRSLSHQRFRPNRKPSIRQIHSKPEYQVQNRYRQCQVPWCGLGRPAFMDSRPQGNRQRARTHSPDCCKYGAQDEFHVKCLLHRDLQSVRLRLIRQNRTHEMH
jgi:hypothetical protein